MRIGYLGPEGTFSEQAALHLAVTSEAVLVPLSSLVEIVQGVGAGRLERGVLPVENSGEGSVGLTLDLLASYSNSIEICDELVIPVRHHLLVRSQTPPETVHTVVSHPQALAQCRRRLAERYPNVRLREVPSTADAARTVAASAPGLAALGSRRAAELYGLDVLDEDVTDLDRNETRFLVLGPPGCRRGRPEKTSLVVSVDDHPGALYTLLGSFARRGLNLTRIESRPARTQLGKYIFFIDFAGGVHEPKVQSLLAELTESCNLMRVLGSYPAAVLERQQVSAVN